MSYEMKDILKTMIDNNEPHWSADTMDMVRVEIHNVYAQATKADDYEAKAKAWDRTQDLLEDCTHQTPGDDYEVDWHEFEIKIDEVISDYESGESDAKK